MKDILIPLVEQALNQLKAAGSLPAEAQAEILISRPKEKSHGDFSCNIAMLLAKQARQAPRALAESLVKRLGSDARLARVDVAGPGFINFTLSDAARRSVIPTVLSAGDAFGLGRRGQGQKVLVEFVSANPTGPLHVGHGRGAAYGAALSDLLEAAGYAVEREYYINDAGRQMDILAASVWLRYLELCGETLTFPTNAYKGDYVWDIAATVHRTHQNRFRRSRDELMQALPPDEPEGGDKEIYIDAVIARCKALLGKDYKPVFAAGLDTIVDDIRDDLAGFGVRYQRWFPESSLYDAGRVQEALATLREAGHLYEKDGAIWFRSSALGDEKDRVVVRENGQFTYFASDIAYHLDKLKRGYDRIINIWGADHHGYVARLRAAIQALGAQAERLEVLLVQFATLWRGGEKQQMSTRSGEFVTLRELRKEVGDDAARFFYVQRKCEQHLDFDLDLAKAQSTDNPVYYVQYAHARVCSVLRQLTEKGWVHDPAAGLASLERLDAPRESELMDMLARYPELIEVAAEAREPHQITTYLRELAACFHSYYDTHKMLIDDVPLREARLCLAIAARQVLKNGLRLIGVSAPERMSKNSP